MRGVEEVDGEVGEGEEDVRGGGAHSMERTEGYWKDVESLYLPLMMTEVPVESSGEVV